MSVSNTARMPVLPIRLSRIPAGTRFLIGVLGLVFVITLFLMLSEVAKDPRVFPVRNVDVLGTLDYTDRRYLSQLVESDLEKGLLAINIERVRNKLETLPWVAAAHIRREWPGRLTVDIEEHEPAARWNDYGLVSKRHEMFVPPQLHADSVRHMEWQEHFSSLPRLTGADGRHDAVLDDYRHYQMKLAALNLTIVALNEDDRHSQTLELSNSVIVKLGYEQQRTRLDNFIAVHDRLVSEDQAGQLLRFDMRYNNGFAFTGRDCGSRHWNVEDCHDGG